jgi:hypothetical protein
MLNVSRICDLLLVMSLSSQLEWDLREPSLHRKVRRASWGLG